MPGPNTNNNKGNLVGGTNMPVVKQETLEKFLELQTQEQAVRAQELQLRLKEIDHNAKRAQDMLAAQERDREKEREHDRRMTRGRLIFWGLVLFAVLIFVGVALSMNKDAFVMEALKLLATFFAGGASGYGVAKMTKSKDDEEE
jgi:cation transport ATPase